MNYYLITSQFRKYFSLIIFIFIVSCSGIWDPADVKDVPVNEAERVKKNMEEGKGFKLFDKKETGGVFQFASSNPLWRASLEIVDFIPLSSASYSGGLIVTDWYSQENETEESIKITIRFLSNEIRPDSIDVLIYKKNCKSYENCQTLTGDDEVKNELKLAILKKATLLEAADLAKK
jgi:hypothetical protein